MLRKAAKMCKKAYNMYNISRKLLPLFLVSPVLSYSEVPLSVHGFVNFDHMYDTRQVVASREGHDLLWPKPQQLDPNGHDINDVAQLSMIPLYTLVTVRADGPNLTEGVENYALFEADFRGTNTENASLFRLRRAYADFDWGQTALRVGKAWHPLYVPGCVPRLVTYDDGEPPDAQVRTPQIRLTHRFSREETMPQHEVICAAASHTQGSLMLGPKADGKSGTRESTDFIRRSLVPNLHLEYRQWWGEHFFGVSGDYVRTIARLQTELGFKEDESLDSTLISGYAALNFPRWSVRMKWLYTENATAYDLPNGFAVATRDPDTGVQTYENLRAFGYWIDMQMMSDRQLRPGVFAGIHKSLGTKKTVTRDKSDQLILFSQEPNLDTLAKVAARARWVQDPIEIGAEVEVSHAAFAVPLESNSLMRTFDNRAQALATRGVTNARITTNLYYYF